MNVILEEKNNLVIRFDPGEELMNGLVQFCNKQKNHAASFTCIGAAQEIMISWYDVALKRYFDKVIEEKLEIASMNGNVAKLQEQTIIHAHGTFTNKNFQTVGGHIKRVVIGGACEVVFTIYTNALKRAYDPQTGLNILT